MLDKKELLKELVDNSFGEAIPVEVNGFRLNIARTSEGYSVPLMLQISRQTEVQDKREYCYGTFDDLYKDLLEGKEWKIIH